MKVADEIAGYRERGFTQEQAEVIVLMRVAAGVIFRDFPDSFLLYGGATLVLFHQGPRHSADLDLDSLSEDPPPLETIRETLINGLQSIAEALSQGPLEIGETLSVKNRNGNDLFTVDINRFGAVIQSEIEKHSVSLDEGDIVEIKAASRNLLLFHKSECFLLRKKVKARDAFDIYDLTTLSGVVLSQHLKDHLTDTLMSYEIEAEGILERVKQIDEKRCKGELGSYLPRELFEALAKEGFKPLRDALLDLYKDWL